MQCIDTGIHADSSDACSISNGGQFEKRRYHSFRLPIYSVAVWKEKTSPSCCSKVMDYWLNMNVMSFAYLLLLSYENACLSACTFPHVTPEGFIRLISNLARLLGMCMQVSISGRKRHIPPIGFHCKQIWILQIRMNS